MPTAETPKDLTATSFALLNISDASWTEIVSGTGIEATHSKVGVILARNTDALASRTLNITVAQPSGAGFDAINVTPPDKQYTLPANSKICAIANMGSYNDPANSNKIVIDASDANVEIMLIEPVSPANVTASS